MERDYTTFEKLEQELVTEQAKFHFWNERARLRGEPVLEDKSNPDKTVTLLRERLHAPQDPSEEPLNGFMRDAPRLISAIRLRWKSHAELEYQLWKQKRSVRKKWMEFLFLPVGDGNGNGRTDGDGNGAGMGHEGGDGAGASYNTIASRTLSDGRGWGENGLWEDFGCGWIQLCQMVSPHDGIVPAAGVDGAGYGDGVASRTIPWAGPGTGFAPILQHSPIYIEPNLLWPIFAVLKSWKRGKRYSC